MALIALNAAPELRRETICLLARQLEDWWPDRRQARPKKSLASRACSSRQLRLARLVARRADRTAAEQLERASRAEARIHTLADPDYPERLRALDLPPPVLYCRGTLPPEDMVAIVGSRSADSYAIEVAELFSRGLAEAGLTIVSGFARGVDTAAHRAAISVQDGRTVAVLGCGLDVEYPRGSSSLAQQVSVTGSLVSEFPFGAQPLSRNFPIRNRIIAAFSLGTLVVQATERSGSLITARLATELGRDVWAVPGRIFDPRAAGPNGLIRDGALLVQQPRDVLESLSLAERDRLRPPRTAAPRSTTPPTPEPDSPVLEAIRLDEAVSGEKLAARTGLAIEDVLARLLELELSGWVRRLPGPTFSRHG